MYQWRVTKYDPAFRDERGRYLADDWTSASDIGREFDGRTLTLEAYLAVEDRYVAAAMHFLRESGLDGLTVRALETAAPDALPDDAPLTDLLKAGPPIVEGEWLTGPDLERAIRLNLRSLIWCKLEEPGRFFIHFGHDYYLYIGSAAPCPESVDFATRIGLFVEEMDSPYHVAAG